MGTNSIWVVLFFSWQTLNDVLLAMVDASLHRYLQSRYHKTTDLSPNPPPSGISLWHFWESFKVMCVCDCAAHLRSPVQTVIDSVVSGQVHSAVSNDYTAPIHCLEEQVRLPAWDMSCMCKYVIDVVFMGSCQWRLQGAAAGSPQYQAQWAAWDKHQCSRYTREIWWSCVWKKEIFIKSRKTSSADSSHGEHQRIRRPAGKWSITNLLTFNYSIVLGLSLH